MRTRGQGFDKTLFLIVTKLSLVCLLLFSMAGYLGSLHKYAELASHFRVQYLLGASACVLAFCLYQEWWWAFVATLAVALNLAEIIPWYLCREKPADNRGGARRLKLILANVNHENTAYESFIAFAQRRAPDVLIIQEVTEDWRESLRPLHGRYPFRKEAPKSRGSGMALYSRFPFERLTIAFPESGARPCRAFWRG